MMNDKIKDYRFWFVSEMSLRDIANLLLLNNVIVDYEYDYENVYEWIVAQTDNVNIDLNISRKHNDGEDVSAEPITLLLMFSGEEPSDKIVERKAQAFARCLKKEIILGTVDYVGNDDFKYHENRKITV